MKMLVTVKELFDKNNIKFWPMYGTLLGFVRDNNFIEWDYDIDIGVWYYDYDKIVKLKKEFENAGYVVDFQKGKYSIITIRTPATAEQMNKKALGKQGIGLELDVICWIKDKDMAVSVLFKNNNCFAKIFDGLGRILNQDYFYRRTTHLSPKTLKITARIVDILPISLYNLLSEIIHILHMYANIKLIMPFDGYSQLKLINVNGVDFTIPSSSEEYLELSYGKDWRVPNRNWSADDEKRINKTYQKYLLREKSNKILMKKRWNVEKL